MQWRNYGRVAGGWGNIPSRPHQSKQFDLKCIVKFVGMWVGELPEVDKILHLTLKNRQHSTVIFLISTS